MQIFQRLSDAVRFILRTPGFKVINYVDDFIGVGVPSVEHRSFACLQILLCELGFTISDKKLVEPTTKAVCLGVPIDAAAGTIAVPDEKLKQISDLVETWVTKHSCTCRQLQSLLGHLIYIHKCVKPSRFFVNHMLISYKRIMTQNAPPLPVTSTGTLGGSRNF